MATAQYDPASVRLILGTHLVTGYAPETFINVQQVESEKWITRVGADGETGRSKRNDFRATIQVTLQQESQSNDTLTELFVADQQGAGVFPVMLKDAKGNTVGASPEAYVQGLPEVAYAMELQNRQWNIYVPRLELHVGGNIPSVPAFG